MVIYGGCSSVGLERFPVEEEAGSSNLLNHPRGDIKKLPEMISNI